MPYTVADYIIERLGQQGVEALFGVPAVYCASMFAAAERSTSPRFRVVVTSSDLEAGYAADGYARVKGLSVVSVAYGVGTLSLINAVAGAYVERSPIVVINGGPTTANINDQNTMGILFSHSMGRPNSDLDAFRPFTAFCERVTQIGQVPAMVDRALVAALTKKHPVYLELPQDLFDATCPRPTGALNLAIPAGVAVRAATDTLAKVKAAAKPVLIVGAEVQRYGLAAPVQSLINKLNIKWTTTLLARSVLSEQHPNFLGVFNGSKAPRAVRDAISQADVVVALGAVFGSGHAALMKPQFRKTIRTWDGQFIQLGAAPEQAGFPQYVAALDQHALTTAARQDNERTETQSYDGRESDIEFDDESAWDGARGVAIPEHRSVTPAIPTPVPNGLSYPDLFATLSEPAFLDPSFIIVPDTFLGIYAAAHMRVPAQNCFITSALWATIGHSVAAGVGASIPGGRRALVLCGDGGFQMTAQALSTMAKMSMNAVVVIVDNGLYGYEQYLLDPSYYRSATSSPLSYAQLARWDYRALASSMGVRNTHLADSVASLRVALANAKANTAGPSVIQAVVNSRSLPSGL